jgi:DNA-directed RNA polymerase specialized sigma24 family protein
MRLLTLLRESSTEFFVRRITSLASRVRAGKFRSAPNAAQAKKSRWASPSYSDHYYWTWVFQNPDKSHNQQMIDALTDNQKDICEMRYGQGMSSQQIAEKLNTSTRAINRTLNRAKNRMREKRSQLDLRL